MAETILFAGPTLARARAMGTPRLHDIVLAAPVRRGDLPARVAAAPPGTMVLADGLFHAALAVGHMEIRDALEAGWQVWGLASMGAIRAREMRHLGVRGFGRVFELYCAAEVDFRDDEVTLLHEPEPPWRELSEPLVHLRIALGDLVARGTLAEPEARRITDDLEGRWFGDRTLPLFAELLMAAGVSATVVARAVRDFDAYRIKSIDLLRFLDERPDKS